MHKLLLTFALMLLLPPPSTSAATNLREIAGCKPGADDAIDPHAVFLDAF